MKISENSVYEVLTPILVKVDRVPSLAKFDPNFHSARLHRRSNILGSLTYLIMSLIGFGMPLYMLLHLAVRYFFDYGPGLNALPPDRILFAGISVGLVLGALPTYFGIRWLFWLSMDTPHKPNDHK